METLRGWDGNHENPKGCSWDVSPKPWGRIWGRVDVTPNKLGCNWGRRGDVTPKHKGGGGDVGTWGHAVCTALLCRLSVRPPPTPIPWAPFSPLGPIKLVIHGPKSIASICRNRTRGGGRPKGLGETHGFVGRPRVWGRPLGLGEPQRFGGSPKDAGRTFGPGGNPTFWGETQSFGGASRILGGPSGPRAAALRCPPPPHFAAAASPFGTNEALRPRPQIRRFHSSDRNAEATGPRVDGAPPHRRPGSERTMPPMAAALRPCCSRYSISARSLRSFSS